jgi:hypothetical protein
MLFAADNKIELVRTKKSDPRLLERMENHYSKPRGFVGRQIFYAVMYNGEYYGHIVGGSATMHLPGRNEFFGVSKEDMTKKIHCIVNNVFFNVTPIDGKYPVRNFTTAVVKEFMKVIVNDWKMEYGDEVIGFETLVEPPRTGELYTKAGWSVVGMTKGFTCKRIAGHGGERWGGVRVWNKDPDNLRPKIVLCAKVKA